MLIVFFTRGVEHVSWQLAVSVCCNVCALDLVVHDCILATSGSLQKRGLEIKLSTLSLAYIQIALLLFTLASLQKKKKGYSKITSPVLCRCSEAPKKKKKKILMFLFAGDIFVAQTFFFFLPFLLYCYPEFLGAMCVSWTIAYFCFCFNKDLSLMNQWQLVTFYS